MVDYSRFTRQYEYTSDDNHEMINLMRVTQVHATSQIDIIAVYMCNASKRPNSLSCVTHRIEKYFSMCNTCVIILVSHVQHIHQATFIDDSLLYPRGNVRTNLNTFLHLFTRRLRVWNPVLVCASAINAAVRSFQDYDGSTYNHIENLFISISYQLSQALDVFKALIYLFF